MADEIKQVLGFDATQALDALRQLDQVMATFEQRLNSSAATMSAFNSRAGKTVAALKQVAAGAVAAVDALQKLNAQQPASGAPAAATGPAAPRPAGAQSAAAAAAAAATAAASQAGAALGGLQQTASGVAAQVNTALGMIGASAKNNLGQASASVARLTVDFQTMVRIVTTQAIVRALSAVRNTFSEAVDDAIAFQRAVARISTISPETSIDTLAAAVRGVSDQFNIPLLQTAEGLYQAISNQVGNAAESITFLGKAAQFAKATNSTLADSVDLLSGALKSFGLGVDDTDKVAGIFFTAIDKGRITADELANTFGRVGEQADQVGITLDEFAGAISAITVKGVKTAEGLTQFRGIITALTKPTDAMKEKLRELGFSSTEAAIATLRLDGLLKALADTTDGSAQEFAKLFPNVRGLSGALGLTGDNLKEFAANIRAAQSAGADLNREKFLQVFQTDAERVTTELNKLKNALTVEVGQAILDTIKNFLELIGGTDALVSGVKTLAPTLVTLTFELGALAVALGTMKLASLAAASSLGPLAAALAAISVIPAAKSFLDQKRIEFANRAVAQLERTNAKEIADFQRAQREKLDDAKQADRTIVEGALRRVQDINRTYLQDVANAKVANEAMVQSTERALNKVIGARERFIQAIDRAIDDSRQQVQESQGRVAELKFKKEDLTFQRDTRALDDAQKVFALTQRAAELAGRAERDLRAAFLSGDKAAQDRALALFQKAEAELESAAGIANRTGNAALEAKVFREQTGLLDRRVATEQRLGELQKQRQADLAAERASQEKIVAELRRQAKVALENTGVFDKQGELLSEQEQARRSAQRQAALKRIAELSFTQKDFKAADALGLASFIQSLETDLRQRPIKLAFDIEHEIQRVNDAIRRSLGSLDLQLPFLKDLEAAVGRSLRTAPDQVRAAIQEVEREVGRLREQISQQDIIDLKIDKKKAEIQELLDSIAGREFRRQEIVAQGGERFLPGKQAIDATVVAVERLKNEALLTEDAIRAAAVEVARGGDLSTIQFDTDIQQIIGAFQKLRELQALEQERPLLREVDTAKLQDLQNVLREIQQSNLGAEFQSASAAIGSAVAPTEQVAQASFNAAAGWERIADAAERAAFAAARIQAPPVATSAHGGLVQAFGAGGFVRVLRRFQSGGFAPRGTDIVPALLSPGEFVINARSSRRFFSQLQAINAGQSPIFRQDGGSVTNVGDINVTVKGGDTGKQTARTIAQELRRELRRRTSRL